MSGAKVEQTSAETLSFRCVCERCRLMRGEVGKLKCKLAFTLAETLITLGIIGVVATLTLPTLISQYQDKVLANKTRKVYSEFQNGLMLASQANDTSGDFSSVFPKNGSQVSVVNNLSKYFNGAKVCTSSSQKECQQFYYNVAYGTKESDNAGNVVKSATLYSQKIILADGAIISVSSNQTGCENTRYTGTYTNAAGQVIYNEDGTPKTYDYYSNICANIQLDVNGVQGPNQFGRDVYHLYAYQYKIMSVTGQKLGGESLNNILSGKDKLIYNKY